MCGRFYVDEEIIGEIRKLCREITAADPLAGEVHPTEQAWILRAAVQAGGERERGIFL